MLSIINYMTMEVSLFRLKIYDKLLEWKAESDRHMALLIEGARRVGKSNVLAAFAKNEYQSYMIPFL